MMTTSKVINHVLTERHDDVVDKSCCCWEKEYICSSLQLSPSSWWGEEEKRNYMVGRREVRLAIRQFGENRFGENGGKSTRQLMIDCMQTAYYAITSGDRQAMR
jgi:hypothetical protein